MRERNGFMFVKGKRTKWLNIARREIDRSKRNLSVRAKLYDEAQISEVNQAREHLEQAVQSDDISRIKSAVSDLKKAVDRPLPFFLKSVVREYAQSIAVAIFLAMIIRAFIVEPYRIPSGSMVPTLLVGDRLVVNKFIYGFSLPFAQKKVFAFNKPQRGDVIVFRNEEKKINMIKRVVGISGDRVEIDKNRISINGVPVEKRALDSYEFVDGLGNSATGQLYEETSDSGVHEILIDNNSSTAMLLDHGEKQTYVVPDGKYFVMGDNRDHSNDSRFWGFVDEYKIKGKAMMIYFSKPLSQLARIGNKL